MPDQLDNEALAFLESHQLPLQRSERMQDFSQRQYSGKAKTRVPASQRRSMDYDYISSEPERFEQYISDFKDEFITEAQARDLIIDKWSKEPSLANLLDGLNQHNVLERELNSLINLPKVQSAFKYTSLARQLKIREKVLKKQLDNLNKAELERIRIALKTKKKPKINLDELFVKTRSGTVKGATVQGRFTPVKIFSKVVPRYRDAKGRFISTKTK